MQAAGAPKNAGMSEAYLSSYLKSYAADRTPSTPEAIAYAARCQGNTGTSHSTQRSRRSAEDRSSPHAAHKQAVNAYDTADFGRAQSGWQAPLEQSGTSDYGADWQAEAAGGEAEMHTRIPDVATTSSASADQDVSDTSSSCDLSLAALEEESEQDRTEEAADEFFAPANSIQTIGAVATQESTAEHDGHAVETAVTDLDAIICCTDSDCGSPDALAMLHQHYCASAFVESSAQTKYSVQGADEYESMRARQLAQQDPEDEEAETSNPASRLWSSSSPHDTFPYPATPSITEASWEHQAIGVPSDLKPPLPCEDVGRIYP